REANLFDTDLDYDHIIAALTDQKGFSGTIEFFPEEGKYHLDGHRKCEVCLEPEQTHSLKDLCPKCGKPLTLGVLYRVEKLADRKKPQLSKPFYSLIPLQEILGEILGCGPASKKVVETYENLLNKLGPELPILMQLPLEKIAAAGGPLLAKAVERMRKAEVIRDPGYDGEYGRIRLFQETEKEALLGQTALFDLAAPKKPKAKKAKPDSQENVAKQTRSSANSKPIFADPILDPLNDEQRAAVLHQGKNLLIVAGPGTGKTLTLTHRIAYLLQSGQARPEAILALTFTNKAAREMQTRLAKLLSAGQTEKIHISTFHRFCLDVLRQHSETLGLAPDFKLLPEQDLAPLVRQSLTAAGTKTQDINRFLKALPQLKTGTVLPPTQQPDADLLLFLKTYQYSLKEHGALDLLDLETETLRLFQNHPEIVTAYVRTFNWILVDEYQDTNPLQSAILKVLVQPEVNQICAIGDPYQAIYGFRGADVKNFLRFTEEFAPVQTIALNRNYRSSQNILNSAAALLAKETALRSGRGSGDPIRLAACRTDAEEAEMIVEQVEKLLGGTTHFSLDSGRVASHEKGADLSFGDLAVLFRLNAQADVLETAFSRAGIPYVRSGEKPLIEQYPVYILRRLFQVLLDPDDLFNRKLYLDLPEVRNGEEILRKIRADQPLPELIQQAATLHEFDLSNPRHLENLQRFQSLSEQPGLDPASFLDRLNLERGIDHEVLLGDRVALMSLHAAKGLEWPVVFIAGCEQGLLPHTLFS
ncbi:MAG: AAA family ATPase, partial [Desulfobacteraceae bacterium]